MHLLKRKKTISLFILIFLFGYLWVYSRLESEVDFGRRAREYNVRFYPNKNYSVSYLQYECVKSDLSGCGGLADRLKGIFSAYAWSLLTNRTFIIRVRDPCPLEDALIPNRVNWSIDSDSIEMDTREDIYMYYDLNYMHMLESIDILNYTNAQLVNVRAALMFMDSFSRNLKLIPKIKELGYSVPNFTVFGMFRTFYSRLFRLAPRLERRYNEFLSEIGTSKLICAQLRFGDDSDFTFMHLSDSEKFWTFINSTLVPYVNDQNWKLYVTSDRETIKTEARRRFGRDRVKFYSDSSVHVEMFYRRAKFDRNRDDKIKFENLILDFHTLQNCYAAVVSHSGFGILGVMNRDRPDRNVWVYTDAVESMKEHYWKRGELRFVHMQSGFKNLYFL